jgi:hypothetical protein
MLSGLVLITEDTYLVLLSTKPIVLSLNTNMYITFSFPVGAKVGGIEEDDEFDDTCAAEYCTMLN